MRVKTSVSASRPNFILAEFLIDHMELQKLINIKPLGIGFGTKMWVRAGGWVGRRGAAKWAVAL